MRAEAVLLQNFILKGARIDSSSCWCSLQTMLLHLLMQLWPLWLLLGEQVTAMKTNSNNNEHNDNCGGGDGDDDDDGGDENDDDDGDDEDDEDGDDGGDDDDDDAVDDRRTDDDGEKDYYDHSSDEAATLGNDWLVAPPSLLLQLACGIGAGC